MTANSNEKNERIVSQIIVQNIILALALNRVYHSTDYEEKEEKKLF